MPIKFAIVWGAMVGECDKITVCIRVSIVEVINVQLKEEKTIILLDIDICFIPILLLGIQFWLHLMFSLLAMKFKHCSDNCFSLSK